MAKTKIATLPDGKTVRLPAGLTKKEAAALLIERLPDKEYKDFKKKLRTEFKIDKESTGIGSAIGGTGGALAGAATGAALGSVVPGIGTVIGGLIGAGLGGIAGGAGGGALGEYAEQKLYSDYNDSIDKDAVRKAALTEGAWGALGGAGGLIGRGGRAGAALTKAAGSKPLGVGVVAGRTARGVTDTVKHAPIIGALFGKEGIERAGKVAGNLPNEVKEQVLDKVFKRFNVNPKLLTPGAKGVIGKGTFDEVAVSSMLRSSDPAKVNAAKRIIERFVTSASDDLVKAFKAGDKISDVGDFVPKKLGRQGRTQRGQFRKPRKNQYGFTPDEVGNLPTREVVDAFKKELYDDIYRELIKGNIKSTGLAVQAGGSALSTSDEDYRFNDGGQLSDKIGLLRREGYPQDQAVAIAHSYKKRGLLK